MPRSHEVAKDIRHGGRSFDMLELKSKFLKYNELGMLSEIDARRTHVQKDPKKRQDHAHPSSNVLGIRKMAVELI